MADSPVPLDVEATRELLERARGNCYSRLIAVQRLNNVPMVERGETTARIRAELDTWDSLASSLSGIADMKRDAERLDWLEAHKVEAAMLKWDKEHTLRNGIDAARFASDSGTERTP